LPIFGVYYLKTSEFVLNLKLEKFRYSAAQNIFYFIVTFTSYISEPTMSISVTSKAKGLTNFANILLM